VSLEYSESSEAISLQPLHLIDEISHRVVNEYTEAICALGQAATAAHDVQARLALTSAATRLRAQVEAHRALQAPAIAGPMDLADYIGQLCACLARAQLAENGMRLRVTADEVWLDADRCWRVGLIVAELVRNAARHGLSGGAGAIWVVVEDAAGHVRCSVCDDGGGSPGVRAGRGRRLVQALAGELGGFVAWSFAPNGCCAVLEFDRPLEPISAAGCLAPRRSPSRPSGSGRPRPRAHGPA
jgi:two-component sensor histidine kinase